MNGGTDAGGIPGVRPLGVSGGFGIAEPAGQPCDDCGERPGVPHGCIGDGAQHRHGMTHVHDGNDTPLRWLCNPCFRHACDVEIQRLYAMLPEYRATEWWQSAVERVQRLRPIGTDA